MSEQQFHSIEKYIGTLKWVATLGWILIAGAFGLGIWVATLEIRQASMTGQIIEHSVSIKNHTTELNGVAVRQAVNSNDLIYIKATVDRIEKKLP